jgi:hypothetical protein
MTKFWVNPEGVSSLGRDYSEQAALFRSYLRQLAELRSRYGNSWGNDDLGKKFSVKFLEGLDTLDRIIGSVADTLEYAGEGLNQTGKSFRAANDEAGDASYRLHSLLGGTPVSDTQHVYGADRAPGGEQVAGERRRHAPARVLRSALVRERGQLSRLDGTHGDQPAVSLAAHHDPATGKTDRSITIDGKTYTLRPVETPPGDELVTNDGNMRLVSVTNTATGESEFTTVSFDGQAYALDPVGGSASEEPRPTGVLSSPMFMPSTSGGPNLVDGFPLAEGYEVLGAREIENGTVRLDVNGYESIVPLGSDHTVATADGQPITPGDGEQLFIVKRDPQADPYAATFPGYEPNYVNFNDDGSAVPYVSDLTGPDSRSERLFVALASERDAGTVEPYQHRAVPG